MNDLTNKYTLIDGKVVSASVLVDVKHEIEELKLNSIIPSLAVVLVGDDPASQVYVRNKKRTCDEVGIRSIEYKLESIVKETELLELIGKLNNDNDLNGILVQFPLPNHINKQLVINEIDPAKDVDGLHPINAGKLLNQINGLVPCTPQGCMIMLESIGINLSGKNALVIGRSNLVGKPMAQLLLNADCTVTHAHSKTTNIDQLTLNADIIIAAVGIPNYIKGNLIKKGSVVIDVGMNRISYTKDGTIKSRLVGDVEFDSATQVVSAITPVPGGVGLMTVACLMRNTILATKLQHNINQ